MIKLRKLGIKDSERMLEWMHDENTIKVYKKKFNKYNMDDVQKFILNANEDTEENLHLAVADGDDNYLGTISLVNISKYNKNAELTYVFMPEVDDNVWQCAIEKILSYARDNLELEEVYINLYEDLYELENFYTNLGFIKGGTYINAIKSNDGKRKMIWYYKRLNNKEKKDDQMIYFQERGDERGHMVIIEQLKDVPFDMKRLFYIYGTDKNMIRGLHANRKSEFVLVNIAGKSKVKVYDGYSEKIYELTKPHTGLYLPKMVWKEMYDFSDDSILLVISNELYDSNEYIRDKSEFEAIVKKI